MTIILTFFIHLKEFKLLIIELFDCYKGLTDYHAVYKLLWRLNIDKQLRSKGHRYLIVVNLC